MTETTDLEGHCLCGQVRIQLNDVNPGVGVCHCNICRRWTGGPFLSVDAGGNLDVQGEDSVGIFNSSDWAERAFCKHCGTHLFYRLKGKNDHFVLAGLFDKHIALNLEREIFIDEKPAYYSFAEDTRQLTG
ncbi:MAG: GFA family protein, partial [Gammaproteobacteria bacterium]|nr:GFA family protein [Gammaproteobacteria bacterium]